jgi:hypothetical protein
MTQRLLDDIFALIFRSSTAIADIIPDVTVENVYEDRLQITQHPVEGGATVSDHAFLQPKVIDLKVGWADGKAGYVGASRDAYEAVLALQAEREPFDVSTGKRLYSNMLVAGVTVADDVKAKYTVLASVRCQEVRIVGANQAQISDQSIPSKTFGQLNVGQVQAQASSAPGGA